MKKYYYYNAELSSFSITIGFKLKPIPTGYVEITKEEYEELITISPEETPEEE